MSAQQEALEKLRKRLDLPEGGKWDYNIARGCWMYTRSTGPNTFTVTSKVEQLEDVIEKAERGERRQP